MRPHADLPFRSVLLMLQHSVPCLRCVPARLQKLRLPSMPQQTAAMPAPPRSPGGQQASEPIDLDPSAGSVAAVQAASQQAASLCELPAPARRSRSQPLPAQPSPVATASGGAAEICEQPAAHGVHPASLPSSPQPSLLTGPAPSPPRSPPHSLGPAPGAAPAGCACCFLLESPCAYQLCQRVLPGETAFAGADTTAWAAALAVASALCLLADSCQWSQVGYP